MLRLDFRRKIDEQTYHTREGKFLNQEVCTLLIFPDLSQCHSPRTISFFLPFSSAYRCDQRIVLDFDYGTRHRKRETHQLTAVQH